MDALFTDALGRPADPASKAAFVQALNSGALSPAQVATLFFTSPEHDQHAVNGYFMQFLNRPADPQGLSIFANMLQAGVRDENVIALIAGSLEYADMRRLEINSTSSMNVLPGTQVTITGAGFDPTGTTSVHFYDDLGFSLTVPATTVQSGAIT